MRNYSLGNWDGSQSQLEPWPGQTDSRHAQSESAGQVEAAAVAFDALTGTSNDVRHAQIYSTLSVECADTSRVLQHSQEANGDGGKVDPHPPNMQTPEISRTFDNDVEVQNRNEDTKLRRPAAAHEMIISSLVGKQAGIMAHEHVQVSYNNNVSSNAPNNISRIFDDDNDGVVLVDAAESPNLSIDIPSAIFFTPSASPSHNGLFTPSPSPVPAPPRFIMSHVSVPPFPRGSGPSHYRRIPSYPVLPRKRPDVQTHMSMGEALQAAMNNNGALYTVSIQRAQKTAGSASLDRSISASEIIKKRKSRQESTPARQHVDKVMRKVVSTAPSASTSTRYIPPTPRLRRREFGYASYNSELDRVQLTICGIPYDSPEQISANTRFLQHRDRHSAMHKFTFPVKEDQGHGSSQHWSTSCKSLRGLEYELSIGQPFPSPDSSDAEEYEPLTEEEDDDDNEIAFIGRKSPPRPTVRSAPRASRSPTIPDRAIRVGTPVSDIEIIPVPPKQPRRKPRAHLNNPSLPQRSVSGEQGSSRRPLSISSDSDQPKSPRPLPRSKNDVLARRGARQHRSIDDDEYLPSAKALGKRRATSPEPHDEAPAQRPQLPPFVPTPQLAKVNKAPKSNTTVSKPAPLLEMTALIANTIKSHPPPPWSPDLPRHPIPKRPMGRSNLASSRHSEPGGPLQPHTTSNSPTTAIPPTSENHPDPVFTVDPASIPNPSSDFLAPNTSFSPFLPHAMASGADSPFLVATYQDDTFLSSNTDSYGFSSPNKQAKALDDPLLDWMRETGHAPGDGTIDPSMLGNHSLPDEDALAPYSPVISPSYLALVAYDSDSSSPLRSPSPTIQLPCAPSSHGPTSTQSDGLPSHSSSYAPSGSPTPSLPNSPIIPDSNLPLAQRSLRALQRPRVPDGMVSTADLKLPGDLDDEWIPSDIKQSRKKKSATRTPAARTPRATLKYNGGDADESSSDSERRPLSKIIVVKRRPASAVEPDWPLDKKDDYCHQCRNKNFYQKHFCACAKQYCIRCLSLRYEGKLTYTFPCSKFTCPYCHDLCTCTVCTRKRGEVYKPLRGQMFAPDPRPLRKKGSPLPSTQRPRLGGKANLPAAVMGPVTYWATIYGVDGEQIGNAFVGNGNEDVVVARALDGASLPKSIPQNRTYVGDVQDSWGFGDRYYVKEVDPVLWQDRNNGPHERIYVGNKARLFQKSANASSVIQDTLTYVDGFSSPLSSLTDDSDEEIGEGELNGPVVAEADFEMAAQEDINHFLAKGPSAEFSPDSLVDTDVARAISLGLIACGMAVQLSSH